MFTLRTPRPAARRRAFPIPFRFFAALAAALCLLLPVAPAARAQVSRLPLVAVLDLNGPAGPTEEIWSRQATDALVLEMQRSGRYDVIPRGQILQQIEALNLGQPLTPTSLIRLGQALGADYVLTGAVTRFATDRGRATARVALAVVLTDPQTGEASNGAYEIAVVPVGGTFGERETLSVAQAEQSLRQSALGDAAFQTVRALLNYTLPQATVLITREGQNVRLNGGTRNGIRVGQEFIILRGSDRVGRVRVTRVSAQDAEADIVDSGKGIRPEDKARAVFTFADVARR